MSRTGTARHKRMRAKVLRAAHDSGLTTCPACGVWLDWDHTRQPNSPEPDEIVPFAVRGETSLDPEHWQVLCRRCNQSKGGKHGRALQTARRPQPLTEPVTSRDW